MHLDDDVAGEALLSVLASVKAGDFSARMPLGWTGVPGKVADSLNDLVIANQALETELARVSLAVGTRAGSPSAWCRSAGCRAGPTASRRSTA